MSNTFFPVGSLKDRNLRKWFKNRIENFCNGFLSGIINDLIYIVRLLIYRVMILESNTITNYAVFPLGCQHDRFKSARNDVNTVIVEVIIFSNILSVVLSMSMIFF